eukprot:366006-Chlamydomonas_euryale.AAC.8
MKAGLATKAWHCIMLATPHPPSARLRAEVHASECAPSAERAAPGCDPHAHGLFCARCKHASVPEHCTSL